jgi:hypothetical protein
VRHAEVPNIANIKSWKASIYIANIMVRQSVMYVCMQHQGLPDFEAIAAYNRKIAHK